MNDQPGRIENAAATAKRNLDSARRRFGTGRDGEPNAYGRWRESHPQLNKGLWFAAALVVLALVVWWLVSGVNKTAAPRGMGGPQPVGVAKAEKGSIDVTINALGTVTPFATVSVRPQVSGQIVRFTFREGQMVEAGDVLAEIDPRTFQAQLDQAKGQLARDVAQLDNARIELQRQRALKAANATSQQNLDNQNAAVKQYEGTVASDAANVKAAQVNFGYTKITSPIAGRTGIRQVDVGNFVSAGQSTPVVVVTQLQPISVLFTVSEKRVNAILARFNSGDAMPVDAYDQTLVTKLATGRLVAIDSQIDTTTGTVKLRAIFDNEDGTLFPNQFVNARLLVNTLRNQVVIPAAAVQRGASGTYVMVVKADKTVSMRAITTGEQQGDRVAVTKGLNPGETVVTDGADRLRDGGEVTIPGGQTVVNVKPPADAAGSAIPSDEERAKRRAAMMAACGADLKKYCDGMQGRDAIMCLREHRDDVSDTCKTVMKKMRSSGGGGGFGGGSRGPGGPPPG